MLQQQQQQIYGSHITRYCNTCHTWLHT